MGDYGSYLDQVIGNVINLGSQLGAAEIKDRYTPTSTTAPATAVQSGTVTTQTTEAGRLAQSRAGYWFPFGDSLPIHKTAAMVGGGAALLALIIFVVKD